MERETESQRNTDTEAGSDREVDERREGRRREARRGCWFFSPWRSVRIQGPGVKTPPRSPIARSHNTCAAERGRPLVSQIQYVSTNAFVWLSEVPAPS